MGADSHKENLLRLFLLSSSCFIFYYLKLNNEFTSFQTRREYIRV